MVPVGRGDGPSAEEGQVAEDALALEGSWEWQCPTWALRMLGAQVAGRGAKGKWERTGRGQGDLLGGYQGSGSSQGLGSVMGRVDWEGGCPEDHPHPPYLVKSPHSSLPPVQLCWT